MLGNWLQPVHLVNAEKTQLCNSSSHARSTAAEARKVAPYSNKCNACCHWAASARLRSTWDDNARWWSSSSWSWWWSWWWLRGCHRVCWLICHRFITLHIHFFLPKFPRIYLYIPVSQLINPQVIFSISQGAFLRLSKKRQQVILPTNLSDKDSEGQMRPHTLSISTCFHCDILI